MAEARRAQIDATRDLPCSLTRSGHRPRPLGPWLPDGQHQPEEGLAECPDGGDDEGVRGVMRMKTEPLRQEQRQRATMPAIDSRSETATVNPASDAKRVIVSTASQPGELVSAPRAPAAPIRGAVKSCQVNRVRAGASNARKPASNAPVERPPAIGESSCRSMRIATPTGRATSRPRRSAGSGASRSSQFPGMRGIAKPMRSGRGDPARRRRRAGQWRLRSRSRWRARRLH